MKEAVIEYKRGYVGVTSKSKKRLSHKEYLISAQHYEIVFKI